MDDWNKWNVAAGGWTEDILKILLEHGLCPDFKDLFKNMSANQEVQDEARIKRETTREVTIDGRFVHTTTLSLIQEGEFEEIENSETGEASVGELENQTADRREEILSDEADES